MATITRAQLVEATERTLKLAPTEYTEEPLPIPESVAAAVREVANTAEQITRCWWVGNCGCLIGTIYGPGVEDRYRAQKAHSLSSPGLDATRSVEYAIALTFPHALRDVCAEHGIDPWHPVYDVVD